MIEGGARHIPGTTPDPDFFKSPAQVSGMTLERFREIALEVMRDRRTPFTAEARLKYIKAKGAAFGLYVDDKWLAVLLDEATNSEFEERLSLPDL